MQNSLGKWCLIGWKLLLLFPLASAPLRNTRWPTCPRTPQPDSDCSCSDSWSTARATPGFSSWSSKGSLFSALLFSPQSLAPPPFLKEKNKEWGHCNSQGWGITVLLMGKPFAFAPSPRLLVSGTNSPPAAWLVFAGGSLGVGAHSFECLKSTASSLKDPWKDNWLQNVWHTYPKGQLWESESIIHGTLYCIE